jgi:ABC-type multidrug transport system fused ATPase/permease subunit
MSESILKALMRMFAIIASFDKDETSNQGRQIVESYLKKQLSLDLVNEYIQIFDEFYAANNKRKGNKKLSSSSVKVLMICEQINEELRQEQKVLVLLQLIEFISYGENITDNELEFVKTVADIFNIPEEEYLNSKEFLFNNFDSIKNKSALLIVSDNSSDKSTEVKHIQRDKLIGKIYILHIPSTNTYVLKYNGSDSLSLNGHHIKPDWGYVFDKGASVRSSKISPVYYSDIVNRFLASASSERVIFEAKKVDFKFKNSPNGIQEFNFKAEGGELIGVMGGSGAGKSTLLNVFNGSLEPQKGEILINGYNVYTEKENIEGVIGFIPQDDLLIEELTVYQNLFYSAKLCFRNLNDKQIEEQVEKTLHELDLFEIKNLKVGDPLNKFISGGQRKRLNIALELIRE